MNSVHLCLDRFSSKCIFFLQSPSRVSFFWQFADRLVALNNLGKAARVIHQGHASGALSHFRYLHPSLPSHKQRSPKGSADASGLFVRFDRCCFESSVVVLLAWAFNLQEAFAGKPTPSWKQSIAFSFGKISAWCRVQICPCKGVGHCLQESG